MLKNVSSMSGLSVFKAGVQFGVNMVVAAAVAPGQYGLIAFTAPMVALIALLTDLGLSSAIVRERNLSREAAGAAFTVMATVAVGGALLLAIAAGPVERIAHMPGLAAVIVGMACAVVLSILATAPRALLERSLRYQLISMTETAALGFAALASLVAIKLNAGLWALIIYNVALQLFRAAVFGWIARRQLALNFDWRLVRPMLSLGGWVLATNLLSFLARNSDNVLIGAYLGAEAVGLYGLAYQFMTVPLMAISWPAGGVLLATLSQSGGGDGRARSLVGAMLMVTAAITFPVMGYLCFGLDAPVRAFMAPKWVDVVAIVSVLAPVGALQSIAAYNGAVLIARGAARLQFMSSIAIALITLVTFLSSLPFGLAVFVKAYAIVSIGTSLISLGLIVWKAEMSWVDLSQRLAPGLVATGAGLAAAWLAGGFRSSDLPHWALATTAYAATGLAVYGLSLKALWGAVGELLDRRREAVVTA